MNPSMSCIGIGCTPTGMNIPGVPVSMSKVGEKGTVVSISGKDEVKRFLKELGFVPGTEITTVSQAGGNIILDVKGSRIAIDRHMANRILFSPGR